MRKSRIVIIISVLLVVALLAVGLFACKEKVVEDPSEGRVVPVATAVQTVYGAMESSDGSAGVKNFTLNFDGTYLAEEKLYDFRFAGAFSITQSNREKDDTSSLLFEIKQSGLYVFAMYYSEGKLYLDFPPYADRALISDFNLAESVYSIHSEKESGVIKTAADTFPTMASRFFTNCRCYSEEGVDRYVFTLSYEGLFGALADIVDAWDAGFTSTELLAALHWDQAKIKELTEETEPATVEFRVQDQTFLSAKLTEGSTDKIDLTSFSLSGVLESVELPSLTEFSEFDFRNFALSGTLYLTTSATHSDRAANYGITVTRDFSGVSYAFDYDFKSHYVEGSGLEFSLALTDPNGKKSLFAVSGEYLYVDLSSFGNAESLTSVGIAKFKIKTEDLFDGLDKTGFKREDEFDFRDKLRMLVLLLSARSEQNDVVTFDLGEEFFDLLSQKLGYQGLFGIDGAKISWNKANDRLTTLTASLDVFGMTVSLSTDLSAEDSSFGKPVAVAVQNESSYYDLSARESTHITMEGTMEESTSFSSDGAMLSALLSSLTGQDLVFTAEGGVGYTADLLYDKNGALKRLFVRFSDKGGHEMVNLFYTQDDAENLHLIYPEDPGKGGVRKLLTAKLASDPLDGFNRALGAEESDVGKHLHLGAYDKSFMVGIQSPMVAFLEEKLQAIYPDLSLSYLSQVRFRRVELSFSDALVTGKVIFDSDNYLTVKAVKCKVTFGDDWDTTELTATIPQKVALLADNDMPEKATVKFTGGLTYTISLLKEDGSSVWEYAGVPELFGTEKGQTTTVDASTTLLGKKISGTITVDLSPATDVELNNGGYISKYDANKKTFSFDRYNDVNPKTVLKAYSGLTVYVEDEAYTKGSVVWDSSNLDTRNNNKKVFIVYPKVETYFGTLIALDSPTVIDTAKRSFGAEDTLDNATGGVALFKIYVKGERAHTTAYSKTFVAYDGFDPLDPRVYSDVLTVTTTAPEGKVLTVENVGWDLTALASVKQMKEEGTLYAYENQTGIVVKAKIYDLTYDPTAQSNASSEVEVKVYFVARKAEKVTMDSSIELPDGVTFEEETDTFIFDVLKIRSITPANTDGVLPYSFVANADDAEKRFRIKGVKWEFDPVENIPNTSGKEGTLTLRFGDSISGYQTKAFSYRFTTVDIVKTELLASEDAEEPIATKTVEDGLDYVLTGLNVYTYQYPAFVRVTFKNHDEQQENYTFAMNWRCDKTFREEDLCNGGSYLLTGELGSDTMTVELSFLQQRITNYKFVNDAPETKAGTAISTKVIQNKTYLSYSVLGAIGEESDLNYTKTDSYPTTLLIACNGGSDYVEVPVTWDISVYKASDIDMLGNGFLGMVKAYAVGQEIGVYVQVTPAVDNLQYYLNEELTKQEITFALLSADENENLVVTDPRLVKNYKDYETIYVSDGAEGSVALKVLSWEGSDGGMIGGVTQFFNAAMQSGKAPNEVSGRAFVQAKIGNDDIGYKLVKIPVNIKQSTLGNITVSGLPFAASSELTGGTTPYAIIPTYEPSGTDAAFDYDFSLAINPYYVDPTAQSSYPAYLNFELDGLPAHTNAVWDLSAIPANAATDKQTAQYRIYAMFNLGENFSNIKISVAVNVLKREIEVVWIGNNSEHYIDIDGYERNPFGENVEGDEVTLDVKVQFKGDIGKYPLKLKYSKKDVVLSYDGSNVYKDVTVRVGNESGGYQEIGGYTIRTISGTVSKIVAPAAYLLEEPENAEGVFFEAEKVSGNKVNYNYYNVIDLGKGLPDRLTITFGIGAAARVVPVYQVGSPLSSDEGVVFDWDRNQAGELGIVLWNPTVGAAHAGVKQSVYNSKQKEYSNPTTEKIFGTSTTPWTMDFTDYDENNKAIFITAGSAIEHFASEILTDTIARENQYYYVTKQEIPAFGEEESYAIGESLRLDAGTYYLYVKVDGDSHYQGLVYKTFTINLKDISDIVELRVNDAHTSTKEYTGAYFTISASLPDDYPIAITSFRLTPVNAIAGEGLKLNENGTVSVRDVLYSGKEIIAYAFSVQVGEDVNNYVVADPDKRLYFTMEEKTFEEGDIIVDIYWQDSENKFMEVIKVKGKEIDPDADLTNGYKIRYYDSKDSAADATIDPTAENAFTAGNTYYYYLEIKVPNYAQSDIGEKGRIEIQAIAAA